jgi:hypothetical protein
VVVTTLEIQSEAASSRWWPLRAPTIRAAASRTENVFDLT